MGSERERDPVTPGLGWRLVEWSANLLDQHERQAVLGDVAESGERWNRALGEVLGLVIRREAAMWINARPLLILVDVIMPLGLLISVNARFISGETSVYVWMYANNTDWELLHNSGFWYVLADASFLVVGQYLTLVCWSWTVGFVIGGVSRKPAWRTSTVLVLVLVLAETALAPHYMAYCWQWLQVLVHIPPAQVSNGPVTALGFYRVAFPFLVQMILVALPAICGMHQGARVRAFRRPWRIGVWSLAFLSLAVLLTRDPGFGVLAVMYMRPAFWRIPEIRWIELVAYWPAAYLAVNAARQRILARRRVLP